MTISRNRKNRPTDRLQIGKTEKKRIKEVTSDSAEPNYDVECMVCGETPTVDDTELCGPCCFGEADTADGNW